MLQLLNQVIHVVRQDGIMTALGKIWRRIAVGREKDQYESWCSAYHSLSAEDIEQAKKNIDGFDIRPLISILMPVYDVDERWLWLAIDSVMAQIYENWQLCIADDCSSKPHVRPILEEYAAADQRIKLVFRPENGHISAASNSALEMVTGEFTALMDHDDELAPEALYFVAKEINHHPAADIIYSDEDKIDESNRRFDPYFKPGWSPDLLYSVNFVAHLIVYRTALIRGIGGFRVGYEGSQDYDLALRAVEKTTPERIRRIPKVLYHWRAIRGSVALGSEEKPYAHERARMAINEHFERTGVAAKIIRGLGQLHRVIHDAPKPPPLVSVIVYGTGNDVELRNILRLDDSAYPTELIVVPAHTAASEPNISKYQRLNAVARSSSGEVLCFIDGSTVRASKDCIDILIGHAIQTGTGAAGAKIVYPNKRIKHAGFILGVNGVIGSAYRNALSIAPGMFCRLDLARNVSAVSIDCLAVTRSGFDQRGGFDVVNFPEVYGDVDLCLRLIELGYTNVWTPWAEIVQEAGAVRESSEELERLIEKWPVYFESDPYYNPNLTLEGEDFSLAFPPRCEKI